MIIRLMGIWADWILGELVLGEPRSISHGVGMWEQWHVFAWVILLTFLCDKVQLWNEI